MAWTQEDLDKLEKQIASGKNEVWHDGDKVSYQSTSELLELRRQMLLDMQNKQSSTQKTRSVQARFARYG